MRFCKGFLDECPVDIPPCFVLDVGLTKNEEWAIVEFNPVWCAGLYGCNLYNVLPALLRACLRREEMSLSDVKWIVERT